MTFSDPFKINTMQELIELITETGFVPFFRNEIEGFSLEEHISPKCWYNNGDNGFWPAWEWKGPVIKAMNCAYGKFYHNRAMYISPEWFPDFANYRRDGYDFDARYEDGLASIHDKELYELIDANAPILSKTLKRMGNYCKNGKKGFDSMITRLQMQCYIISNDFRYAVDRSGNEYGWGLAEYTTPERLLGNSFTDKVYRNEPKESYEKLLRALQKILPDASLEQLKTVLK